MDKLLSIILFLSCLSFAPREVFIDAKPLHQVIELISIGSNINIVVNWNELEQWGIDKDQEITLQLHDITYETLLKLVLDQAGAGDIELGYVIDEGVIYISTKEDLNRKVYSVVYDIRDLLINVPNFYGRTVNVDHLGNNNAGGIGGGKYLSGNTGSQQIRLSGSGEEIKSIDVNSLLELIRQTIDPESWRQSGGNAMIRNLGSQIIVTQTSSGHHQLRDL